jgi:hypothetical protein
MVKSRDKKIAFEFYTAMVEFRMTIAKKLNLKVEDDFNALWDYIVN